MFHYYFVNFLLFTAFLLLDFKKANNIEVRFSPKVIEIGLWNVFQESNRRSGALDVNISLPVLDYQTVYQHIYQN